MRAIKTEICNFVVPGRAIPVVRMTQRSKFTPRARRYLAYKNQVAWTAKASFKGKPTKKDVQVHVDIYLNGGLQGDVDNYFKSIADSLNEVVYEDDRQVKEIFARKIECDSDADERVEVTVYEI